MSVNVVDRCSNMIMRLSGPGAMMVARHISHKNLLCYPAMVADVLGPNRHQAISTNLADLIMAVVSLES